MLLILTLFRISPSVELVQHYVRMRCPRKLPFSLCMLRCFILFRYFKNGKFDSWTFFRFRNYRTQALYWSHLLALCLFFSRSLGRTDRLTDVSAFRVSNTEYWYYRRWCPLTRPGHCSSVLQLWRRRRIVTSPCSRKPSRSRNNNHSVRFQIIVKLFAIRPTLQITFEKFSIADSDIPRFIDALVSIQSLVPLPLGCAELKAYSSQRHTHRYT